MPNQTDIPIVLAELNLVRDPIRKFFEIKKVGVKTLLAANGIIRMNSKFRFLLIKICYDIAFYRHIKIWKQLRYAKHTFPKQLVITFVVM